MHTEHIPIVLRGLFSRQALPVARAEKIFSFDLKTALAGNKYMAEDDRIETSHNGPVVGLLFCVK